MMKGVENLKKSIKKKNDKKGFKEKRGLTPPFVRNYFFSAGFSAGAS
jgi:hypothetical protein